MEVSSKDWLEKATAFANDLKWDDALQAIDKALEMEPKNTKYLYNKSFALLELNKFEASLQCIDEAININSADAGFWVQKGRILSGIKSYSEAIVAFDKALAYDSKNVDSLYEKALALFGLQRYSEVIKLYNKAIELSPKVEYWHNKGVAHLALLQHADALSCFEEVIRRDPERPKAWHSKGNVLSEMGRFSEAINAYDESIRLDPENSLSWGGKGSALVMDSDVGRKNFGFQCIYRSAYLALKYFNQDQAQHILWLLEQIKNNLFMPLLTQELLIKYGYDGNSLLLSSYAQETRQSIESALTLIGLINISDQLDGNEKLWWQIIIEYYFGDATKIGQLTVDKGEFEKCDNLMHYYYMVLAAESYLEPCEEIKKIAVEKARSYANRLNNISNEQVYYAGLILCCFEKNIDEALKCFCVLNNHLASLYMQWYCLNITNRQEKDMILQKILECECGLQRKGICGYFFPKNPPKIDVLNPSCVEDLLFYIHFREIDSVVNQIIFLDDFCEEKYPLLNELMPLLGNDIMGERNLYYDKALTFQFVRETIQTFIEYQKGKTTEYVEGLGMEIKVWLNNLPLQSGSSMVEEICRKIKDTDLDRNMVPFCKIINYYYLDKKIDPETAVFLHYYYQLKIIYDNAGGTFLSTYGNEILAFFVLSSAINFLMPTNIETIAEIGKDVCLSLIPYVKNYIEKYKTSCLRSQPFPEFKNFKNEFYEWQSNLGQSRRDALCLRSFIE